jgi:serine/threonine protein kinase
VCDLSNLAKHCGGLPEDCRELVMGSTFCALNHLHHQWIAHRDIKEDNILIFRDGTPVVVRYTFALNF